MDSVNPMTDIYNSLRSILKDNNIVTADTLEEQSIVKVQNELSKLTKNSQIELFLSRMTNEMKNNNTEENARAFTGNFETIERIDELES